MISTQNSTQVLARSPLWRSRFVGYNQPAPRLGACRYGGTCGGGGGGEGGGRVEGVGG